MRGETGHHWASRHGLGALGVIHGISPGTRQELDSCLLKYLAACSGYQRSCVQRNACGCIQIVYQKQKYDSIPIAISYLYTVQL